MRKLTTLLLAGTLSLAFAQLPDQCSFVELEFWNPFTGPDGPYMNRLAQGFSDENPNVMVNMSTIPGGEYGTQLSTAAASNTLPAVAIIWADQVATWAFRNVFRPIDSIVETMGLTGDDFPEAVWAAGEVAGQRYAIPLDIHPMTMFYNADMLSEAGLDAAPTNREEFEAFAEAASAGNRSGFVLTSGFPNRQIFELLLHQFGGSAFNEDGTEVTWDSEAGIEALTWMRDAQTGYGEANLEVDAELNAFRIGNVGMVWNGIWQTTNVTGDAVEFSGMATAVPQIGDQMAVWAGSHQLAVPRQPNEDACRDAAVGMFIQYLLDNSVEWARAGQIPASNTVRASEEFAAVEPQASIAPSVEHAFFPPSVPGITDAYAPLDEAVGSIMAGTASDIAGTLRAAAMRGNEVLEQNRRNYGDAPGN